MKLIPLPSFSFSLLAGALLALHSFPPIRAIAAEPADESLTLHVTPERDLIYRGGPREVIVEVEVTAKRPSEKFRSPVNIAVVLDRSGSMEGPKIEKARQAACAALDRLEPDDYFSLVIFDDHAQVFLPAERVGSRAHREELKERIGAIRPGGSTALYAGVQLGAKEVRRYMENERVNRIILLSDGIANVGPKSTPALVEAGRDLRKEGMSVTTIGLGEDFNEDLMTALAEASHANYYYVQDVEKLPRILESELGSASARVASGIRIRIEAPAGVRVREILGHPEIRCEDGAAEIALPEMFGAEQRLFHLRCSVDEAHPENAPVAKVALSYRDAATQEAHAQNVSASVSLTDDPHQADTSVREATARNVAALENRLDKEAAVRLADQGRAKDAADLLRKRVTANAAAPAVSQIRGVDAENQKLESLANELSTQGSLGNASRKAAQWDNYQDRNQRK